MPDIVVLILIASIALLIAILSLLPADARIMRLMTSRMHRAGHFASYVLFACFCALALTPAMPTWGAPAGFLIAAAFGVGMEFLQRFRPGRSPSRVDALVNAAGAALGALLSLALA